MNASVSKDHKIAQQPSSVQVPPTSARLSTSLPDASKQSELIIQKEQHRQWLIQHRLKTTSIDKKQLAGDANILHAGLFSLPDSLDAGLPNLSTDSISPAVPSNGWASGGTPRQRFCLVDLVDDADAVYGRIQWGNDGYCMRSAEDRRYHAEILALRFPATP